MQALRRLLVVALLVPAAAGCQDKVSTPAASSLARGKDCLAMANFACAMAEFTAVEPVGSQESVERAAGIALTRFASWLQAQGRPLVKLADVLAGDETSAAASLQALVSTGLEGDGFLTRTVYNLFAPDVDSLAEVIADFDALFAIAPTFAVHYEAVPLMVGNVPLFILTGDLTQADFRFLKAWLHMGSMAMEMLLAADVEFSIGELIRYGLSDQAQECQKTDDTSRRKCLARLTAFVFGNTPTLLRPDRVRGEAYRRRARASLASFFAENERFFAALASQPVSNTELSLQWVPRPDGGAWVEWHHARVPMDAAALTDMLREKTALTPPFPAVATTVKFIVDAGVPAGVGAAAAHVSSGVPSRVPAATSIMPVLVTMLEFLLQSESVISLLQVIAEGIDPGVATDIADIARDVRRFYSDFETADAVHNLFMFLVPTSLELDLTAPFRDPAYLRAWFPAGITEATCTACNNPAQFSTWKWLVEFECAEDAVDLGFCLRSAPWTDAPHFVGTPYELGADGILSPVPYSAMPDPSLGGLLWFDPWEVDPRFPRGITVPDLEQFNRLIIDLGSELSIRLSSGD